MNVINLIKNHPVSKKHVWTIHLYLLGSNMLIFEGVVHPDPLTSFTLIRKVRITYVLLYAIYVRLICQGNPGPPKTATYKSTMYHHLPGGSDPMSWCTLVAGMLDHRWVEVARDKHKQTKMPSLRFIGPSYGGVWICIAGFLWISKPLVLRSMILRVVEMFNKQKHRIFLFWKLAWHFKENPQIAVNH